MGLSDCARYNIVLLRVVVPSEGFLKLHHSKLPVFALVPSARLPTLTPRGVWGDFAAWGSLC